MPVDSQMPEDYTSQISQNFCNDHKLEKRSEHSESTTKSEKFCNLKDNYVIAGSETETANNIMNGNSQKIFDDHLVSVRPKTFSDRNSIQHKFSESLQPNKWRRMVGFCVSGAELKSALFSRKLKSKKLRFAQAKKQLNQLYSYFSVKILDCEDSSRIVVGLSRKDFPSTFEIGKGLGSVGFCGSSGQILSPHEESINAVEFSKGDVIGCGIVFPPHYRRYADLSTDDSSDGMTDVVLTSLLNVNKKSMDFVQTVLGLKLGSNDSSSSEEEVFSEKSQTQEETDYYNENYVESRTKVEVYFTLNMQIVGKISTCVPVGGFYPTIQVLSPGEVWFQFDFS